jgi:hypothetical protein
MRWILVVLLVGNILIWFGLRSRHPGLYSLAAFTDALGRELEGCRLESKRFPDSLMLPENYVYLEIASDGRPRDTVLVAHYQASGLLMSAPHDSATCYAKLGWSIEPAEPLQLGAGAEATPVEHLRIRRGSTRGTVAHWLQYGSGSSNWLHNAWQRFASGRSDFVWVRVEFFADADVPSRLSRLREIQRAVRAAFRD